MTTLNPCIIEALEAHHIKFVGNPDDVVMLNVATLVAVLQTVYEYGETHGLMTKFYESEHEHSNLII
jgi:hypothetical protein